MASPEFQRGREGRREERGRREEGGGRREEGGGRREEGGGRREEGGRREVGGEVWVQGLIVWSTRANLLPRLNSNCYQIKLACA